MLADRDLRDDALRRLGWTCPALFVVVAAGRLAVGAMVPDAGSDRGSSSMLTSLALLVATALYPVAGLLIVRRRPRNRVGWLLLVVGLSWALTFGVDAYASAALQGWPGTLPGGEVAEVLNDATWVIPVVLTGIWLPVLFPTGRPPGPRERWLLRIALVDMVALVLGIVLSPGPVEFVALAMLPICFLAAAVGIVRRFHRATGAQRLQLKWLVCAATVVAVVFAAATVASLSYADRTPGWVLVLVAGATLSFGLLPVAIGIAVTRHGLYGIDRLISRALTATVLGAFITAVYVGTVVGVGTLIGQRRPSVALSVVATGLVAVAFQPVRERVQHLVNRLVYGDRATPYEVLADFAVQMTGRYTTGELMPRLAQTLSGCLGGAEVSIWLRTGTELTRGGVWPATEGTASVPAPQDDPLAGLTADRVVPVRHREELLGAISVTKHAQEPFLPAETSMLEQVSSQAGLMLRNLRLVEDLQSSRRRLVSSQDDERRRLERDLHDGAQQSLVSVAIMLQIATAQEDEAAQADSLAAAAAQLRTAIDELRELAHGIHPAILTERGLGPALGVLAGRSAVPVDLNLGLDRRLPATVESTLYFVAAEALANVAKYASARRVSITLTDDGERVGLAVRDDGVGGANMAAGTGLTGLLDRVAVVDGTLALHSPPGEGTMLTCSVPVRTVVPAATLPGPHTGQEIQPGREPKVLQELMSPVE